MQIYIVRLPHPRIHTHTHTHTQTGGGETMRVVCKFRNSRPEVLCKNNCSKIVGSICQDTCIFFQSISIQITVYLTVALKSVP